MIRIISRFYLLMLKSCFNSGDIFCATTQVVLPFQETAMLVSLQVFHFSHVSREARMLEINISILSRINPQKGLLDARISWKSRKRVSSSTSSNTTTVTHNSCVLGKNEERSRSIVKSNLKICGVVSIQTHKMHGRKSSVRFISYQKKKICQLQIFLLLPQKKFGFFQSIQVQLQLFRDQIYVCIEMSYNISYIKKILVSIIKTSFNISSHIVLKYIEKIMTNKFSL